MKRLRNLVVTLCLVAAVLVVALRFRDCSEPRPSDIPIPVADGPGANCLPPAPEETRACPYPPAPGPVDGIDYAAPFEVGPNPCHFIGKLRLQTGRLAAVDPLVFLDAAEPLEPAVPPGDYPVVLRIHDGDVALALLMITDRRPVRWAPAQGTKSAGPYAYGVDAGTGCYIDAATAALLRARENAELDRRFAILQRRGVDPYAWTEELGKIPTSPDLLTIMRGEGYDPGRSVNVCVDRATGGNMIAFSSGAGDGAYPVFVGTDAAGKAAAFVTDFGIIDSGSGRHPWIENLEPR